MTRPKPLADASGSVKEIAQIFVKMSENKPTLRQIFDGGWIRMTLFGYGVLFIMFAVMIWFFSFVADMPPPPRTRWEAAVHIFMGFLAGVLLAYINATAAILQINH